MAFRVGQKVVCVDDCDGRPGTEFGCGFANGLRNGTIYTVAKIYDDMIDLVEVKVGGWFARRFRPAVETSTDTGMAILREILDRETIKDGKPVRVS